MNKQRGSMLIEFSVVLVLLVFLAVHTVSWLNQQSEKQRVESVAVWMLRLQQGVQFYLDSHARELTQQTVPTIDGVQQALQPTILELQQFGFLPESFTGSHAAKIQTYQEGACPGEHCHVQAVIYYTTPFLQSNGVVNQEALAQWQQSTSATGFFVTEAKPDWLMGKAQKIPNTQQALGQQLPVGTVALVASTDSQLFGFIRPGDSRDPDFQGDVSVEGALHVGEDVSVGRYLLMPHTENKGATCLITGAVVRGSNQDGLLVCELGKWTQVNSTALDGLTVKTFFEQLLGWTNNPLPLHAGGYFGLSLANRGTYQCWLNNPLSGGCNCVAPARPTSNYIRFKRFYTYYSGDTKIDTRDALIYGCS